MRSLFTTLTPLLVLAIACQADDKDKKAKIDKTKLVGTWTFVKTDAKDAPPDGASMKVEFTKDGKVTLIHAFKEKEFKVSGTYVVEGDKLTVVLKAPKDKGKDKTEVMTVTELTDKRMVTKEKKGDAIETTEFKK